MSCTGDANSTNDAAGEQTADNSTAAADKEFIKVGKMTNKYTNFPAHDWVVDMLKANNRAAANQCKLEGKIIYFVTECKDCPQREQLAEVYMGDTQEKLCEIGGKMMVNTCSEVLRSTTTECKPIFLE
ncbi:MAG: hypothetical protein AAGG75_18680 [Bacteroidota bacterium]